MDKRPKSEFAFIVSTNIAYEFGVIATMNAQNYFGTNADWEIAYEDFSGEKMAAISAAFPFHVNWTPISELMPEITDRRSNRAEPLNRFWLAYWLLARKVLRDGKYKAVCVIQGDTFVLINVDTHFQIAKAGVLGCSEYCFSQINAEELPFGNTQSIWDRGQCAIFDAVNFIGEQYVDMIGDIINYQCEDSFKGEANHSVIALNRAACKHGKKHKMLRLDRFAWVCESIWPHCRLHLDMSGDKVFNDRDIQINAWHCRWWQYGRAMGEWRALRDRIKTDRGDPEFMSRVNNMEHNYNLVKKFMERFNDAVPSIKSQEHEKGTIRRPRYESGEE